MAPRCSGSSSAFLPFLYPSLFLSKARSPSRPRPPAVLAARRHHVTETTPPAPSARLNPNPDDYYETNFADKARLNLRAGDGGAGCISFARDAYLPDGPANGGDGGHGGNIYIQAAHGETSLHKLARRRNVRASRGTNGQGSDRSGKRGDDVIITVPVGTVVRELEREDPEAEAAFLRRARRSRDFLPDKNENKDGAGAGAGAGSGTWEEGQLNEDADKWVLYAGISSAEAQRIALPRLPERDRLFAQPRGPVHLDLSRPTPRPILLCVGGMGGMGNPHFVSRERPRPLFATKGDRAVSMKIELELKLLADVGLVGLPNAGKSTLVRALTNSRARVGSWAFTTLQPNIGTVVLDRNEGRPLVTSFHRRPVRDDWGAWDEEETEVVRRARFTIADIPGLIEGAHLDRGLGIAFLRHVERAGVLAFVVDLGAGDAVGALKALWTEVGSYAQMKEEEERDRERETRINYSSDDDGAGSTIKSDRWDEFESVVLNADAPGAPENKSGLHIAAKPWFVVATKGDLPGTRENFAELRDYMTRITYGDEPHPSGIEGAWVKDCAAIPVSAIKGEGMERIIHWTVGLLDC